MRFLILLSALIAGMTGLIAGSATARAGEPTAIAAVLRGEAQQARATVVQARPVDAAVSLAVASLRAHRAEPLAPQSHPVNERRNE